jgi:hypothetical protein
LCHESSLPLPLCPGLHQNTPSFQKSQGIIGGRKRNSKSIDNFSHCNYGSPDQQFGQPVHHCIGTHGKLAKFPLPALQYGIELLCRLDYPLISNNVIKG